MGRAERPSQRVCSLDIPCSQGEWFRCRSTQSTKLCCAMYRFRVTSLTCLSFRSPPHVCTPCPADHKVCGERNHQSPPADAPPHCGLQGGEGLHGVHGVWCMGPGMHGATLRPCIRARPHAYHFVRAAGQTCVQGSSDWQPLCSSLSIAPFPLLLPGLPDQRLPGDRDGVRGGR